MGLKITFVDTQFGGFFEVFSKFLILHILSCFKLIPMILTLQCHLFDHTICNGNSTLYSKMGRILSISWGNGAQNYVCRHPVWRLYEVFSKFAILHYSSCFKLIPMILTLQCHLFDHTICNGNSTLYSKMGRILSISWGNGAQNYDCNVNIIGISLKHDEQLSIANLEKTS